MPNDPLQTKDAATNLTNCCRSTFWTAFLMGSFNTLFLCLLGWAILSLLDVL